MTMTLLLVTVFIFVVVLHNMFNIICCMFLCERVQAQFPPERHRGHVNLHK